eukprot:GHVU01015433.1.p1 GENE.GHVU01015433.1~~GHVU01015433.1.p1  ORF type:complete len:103 (+),score=22.48 GHVU01015433.1:616-924(+)
MHEAITSASADEYLVFFKACDRPTMHIDIADRPTATAFTTELAASMVKAAGAATGMVAAEAAASVVGAAAAASVPVAAAAVAIDGQVVTVRTESRSMVPSEL